MYAVLQSGQQRTETAEAYYHRLDNAFLDLVAEVEEHEGVEAPSHNQVVTLFLTGLRPEYEPIIGILQVTAEHEGRAITWEADCLKLAQNYSKRIEKNHASEPSAEGYIACGGTKRSAHLATGDGSGPRRLGAPLRGGCWQCGGPHFKRDCPQRPRGNMRQASADPAPAAFVADEEEEHVAFMAENAGNTPPAKRVALSLLNHFRANEREHDLDSQNMDEIISLSGLSDCFGMSDDEAGSASGGMGGSARVVTKSDSAYLLDAVALATAVVDARGACMLGLNDDLGSFPDMWALLDNGGVGSTSDASRVQEITEAHRHVDETDDVEEELEIEEGGQLICILVVDVDDMIFAFKDAVWAADFKTALGARFDIKDLGVCAWALGMAVERDWDNAMLKVHQAKYIDDMMHKFNLAHAYAVSTPAEVGADVPGSNKPLAAEMPYHALVGSLLYAMVATRPDIAEAVPCLVHTSQHPFVPGHAGACTVWLLDLHSWNAVRSSVRRVLPRHSYDALLETQANLRIVKYPPKPASTGAPRVAKTPSAEAGPSDESARGAAPDPHAKRSRRVAALAVGPSRADTQSMAGQGQGPPAADMSPSLAAACDAAEGLPTPGDSHAGESGGQGAGASAATPCGLALALGGGEGVPGASGSEAKGATTTMPTVRAAE
eukprot:jgi/Tetstr1/462171/TSEL_007236.t1